jgi:hypothetical protein
MERDQRLGDTPQFSETQLHQQEQAARKAVMRVNAQRVLRESGLAQMLLDINRSLLKGRGRFEEYGSTVLFRWGTQSTLRHIWVEVQGNTMRFRLRPHRRCQGERPSCDGEYHTFTSVMWSDRAFLWREVKKYYDRPVAESSAD